MKYFWWLILIVLTGGGLALYILLQRHVPKNGPKEVVTHRDISTKSSTVTIPISMSLDRIEDGLRKKIRKLHFSQRTTLALNAKRKEKRIEKGKDPSGIPVEVTLDLTLKAFNINTDGNQLVANASYDMQFLVTKDNDKKRELAKCGYGDGKPRLKFTLKSNFKMLPTGDVVLSNKTWDLQWENPCVLTVLDMITVSAEELLQRPALKEKLNSLLDTVVANKIPQEIDIIPMLNKTWISLQKPLRLGPDLFLNLNPEKVMLGDLVGNGSTLNMTVTALCTPQLTAGMPDTTQPVPLSLVDTLQADDSLRFNLVTSLSLEKLEHMINTKLKRRKFDAGNVEVKMGRIRAYQHNDEVVFRIRMMKPFRGEIYLQGKPQYDPANDGISFESFNYSIATAEMLGRLSNVVVDPTLLKTTIENELKKVTDKTLISVLTKYESFSKDLKNNVAISGGLKDITPRDVVVSDNQIKLLSEVTGVLRVEVNRKTKEPSEKPIVTGAAASAKLAPVPAGN